MKFGATSAGKPYITTPGVDPAIAYNVSHDNALVAMAFAPAINSAHQVGVDVMKVRVPGRESLAAFVNIMDDQLTPLEKRVILNSGITQAEALSRFYWIWTMKEAYTKALGLGLGFNFRRIEFDVPNNCLTIDGVSPIGWSFRKFVSKQDDGLYQGVAAEFHGGTEECTIGLAEEKEISQYEATTFVEDVLRKIVR